MSDQPIPQEVGPVRGLVEALEPFAKAFRDAGGDLTREQRELAQRGSVRFEDFESAAHALTASVPEDDKPICIACAEPIEDGDLYYPVRGLREALDEAIDALDSLPVEFVDTVIDQARANGRTALASYRAWEEGGGSDSAGRSGRPQEAPPDGWRPIDTLPDYGFVMVAVWEPTKMGGLGALKKHSAMQAERVRIADWTHWHDYPGISYDRDAAPPPPAGVDRPETEGEAGGLSPLPGALAVATEALEAARLKAAQIMCCDAVCAGGVCPRPHACRSHEWLPEADQIIALLAQQKERG